MTRLHMRQTAALACVTGLLLLAAAGCQLPAEVRAARTAITDEQVPGIKESHAIGWGWPELWREFTDVQDHAFSVGSDRAEGGGTRLYVVEGRDVKTGQWRVIYAAKQRMNGQWVPIQLTTGAAPLSQTAQPLPQRTTTGQ